MDSSTELTTQQRFERLKKVAHRVTFEERIEAGKQQFEGLGVDPEDVEQMARLVDLEAVDLYLAVSGTSTGVTKATVEAEPNLSDRLCRLEEIIARIAVSNGRIAPAANQGGDADVVTHLRRIADHFDPPNRDVVGTPYIAERLGVTTKWIGDLVRTGEIPKSCICPKAGGGKYWRFWKQPIDKWIEER